MSKVITAAAESIVFRIPNPWTVGVLTVLQKIYHDSETSLSLKFEIKVLFHQMQSDINSFDSNAYPPFRWNQSRTVQNNEEDRNEAMVRRIVNRVIKIQHQVTVVPQNPVLETPGGAFRWNERVHAGL